MHGSNMHQSFTNLANSRQHLLAFDSAFRKDGARIPNRRALQWLYKKTIALYSIYSANDAWKRGDLDEYHEYMAFAVETFPAIRATRTWTRMRAKQALGRGAVGFLQSLLGVARPPRGTIEDTKRENAV
jgi:hypothetical protein